MLSVTTTDGPDHRGAARISATVLLVGISHRQLSSLRVLGSCPSLNTFQSTGTKYPLPSLSPSRMGWRHDIVDMVSRTSANVAWDDRLRRI